MTKIKANKDITNCVTAGQEYDVIKKWSGGYEFINDVGEQDYAHKSHFTDVTIADAVSRVVVNADQFHVVPTPDWIVTKPDQDEEPVIEVGSEWVDHKKASLTVNYVGEHQLLCTWNDTGKEFASSIKNHLKFFKPKPKTVTMYFYQVGDGYKAYDRAQLFGRAGGLLFTREIELP